MAENAEKNLLAVLRMEGAINVTDILNAIIVIKDAMEDVVNHREIIMVDPEDREDIRTTAWAVWAIWEVWVAWEWVEWVEWA